MPCIADRQVIALEIRTILQIVIREGSLIRIGHTIGITLRVMRAMDEQSVTQVELAKRMGCTQQYVSNLLKGSSNMTLETIARLENALGIDLVKLALTYVSGHGSSVPSRPQYLSDSAGEKHDVTKGDQDLEGLKNNDYL